MSEQIYNDVMQDCAKIAQWLNTGQKPKGMPELGIRLAEAQTLAIIGVNWLAGNIPEKLRAGIDREFLAKLQKALEWRRTHGH